MAIHIIPTTYICYFQLFWETLTIATMRRRQYIEINHFTSFELGILK